MPFGDITLRDNGANPFDIALSEVAPAGFPPELFHERLAPVHHEIPGPFVFLASILALLPPPEPFPEPLLKRKPAIVEIVDAPSIVVRAAPFALFEVPAAVFPEALLRLRPSIVEGPDFAIAPFRALPLSLLEAAPVPFPPELLARALRVIEVEPPGIAVFRAIPISILEAAPPVFPVELLARAPRIAEIEVPAVSAFRSPAVLFPAPVVAPFPTELLRLRPSIIESDVGVAVSLFVPEIASILAPPPVSGTIKSFLLSAGSLGTTKGLRIEAWLRRSVGSSGYRPRLLFGGVEVLVFPSGASALQRFEARLFAAASVSVQRSYGKRDSEAATGTSGVDSSLAQLVEIVVDKDQGADTVVCDYFTVEKVEEET